MAYVNGSPAPTSMTVDDEADVDVDADMEMDGFENDDLSREDMDGPGNAYCAVR